MQQKRRRRRRQPKPIMGQVEIWLAKAQRAILLTAIVLVALVVLPESTFVDITSTPKTTILRMLGTLQAGILLSRLTLALANPADSRLTNSLQSIRETKSTLAILISAAAVTIISIISSMLSVLPHQSWWGRNPAGFEAGEYTALMYVVLSLSAFITVKDSRSTQTIWRTLAITGFLAGLVGLFQFFGLSPLDISSTHNSRITGTNGNPIFYGAMLVLLAPVTLSILVSEYLASSPSNKRWWLTASAISAFILMLSLTATVGRGAWIGAFVGGISALAFIVYFGRAKIDTLPIAIVVTFAVLGGLVTPFFDPSPVDTSGEISQQDPDNSDSAVVVDAFASVGRTNSFDIRKSYWKMSLDIATSREPVPFTKDAPAIVRWFVGYGPDTFRYVGAHFLEGSTFTRRLTAAHNDPINRLVEQGILGLIAWLSLWASLAYGVIAYARRTNLAQHDLIVWIIIGTVGALAGRFTEQMFGSPTPGGVLIFWILVGVITAHATKSEPPIKSRATPHSTQGRNAQIIALGIVSITLIGSAILAWDKGANYLIANQIASFQYRPTVTPANEAIERLERATAMAPDVARYWHSLSEIEHGRATSTTNPQVRSEALLRAYEYDLKAHEVNPVEVGAIYDLAFSAWEAAGDDRPELRQEALKLYEKLTLLIPADELAKERLEILTEFLSK